MKAERLLAHFKTISEAPDAVARLRRFILDLAVRGKLVEQDPEDEPAEELLAQIAGSGLEMDDLPSAWCRAELGSVLVFQYGKGLAASERLDCGLVPVYGSNGIVGYTDRPLFDDSSIIVGRKGSAGALNLCQGPSWATDVSYYVAAPAFFSLKYLLVALAALDLDALGKGVKPGLSRSDAYAQLITIPPLAEQHRIVAKVDELMVFCDQLEAARQQREQGRERLVAATLQRLNQPAADPASFRQDASFALQVLPHLTTTPAQIKQLRQTILNLAVRGKLVEQDPEDEPAEELVRLIADDKKLRMAERRIRAPRNAHSVNSEDVPLDLPPSWKTFPLGDISLVSDPNPSHRYPSYDGGTVPILSTQEFSGLDGWNPSTAKLVQREFHDYQVDSCNFEPGDIVFARKGRIGLPRFLPSLERYAFSHTVFIVKPLCGVYPQYLLWALRRQAVVDWLTKEMNQNTGVPTLGKDKTERLPIPLPPLSEQHRIVAKVDELMALCDQLEQQLSQADQQRRRLLEALLAEALDGRLPTEQEESHAAIA